MESQLERAALDSNLDVAAPVNADSMKQVRYTNGHGVKKSLEFGQDGECELFLEECKLMDNAKQVVHHSL